MSFSKIVRHLFINSIYTNLPHFNVLSSFVTQVEDVNTIYVSFRERM